MLFFWLRNTELATERVKTRVLEGGHDIPENIIVRRFYRGIKNLFDMYIDIVDQVLIFDNSEGVHQLIAEKTGNEDLNIIEKKKFKELKECYDQGR